MPSEIVPYDAVIVAGGAGTRMGGVSKADLIVDGSRLVESVVAGVHSARTIVVVGSTDVPDGVVLTHEDPPGTGPAAGLGAGLAVVNHPSPWTLVLSVDLPDAARVAARLLGAARALEDHFNGAVIVAEHRTQWLMGCYRTRALRRAVDAFGPLEHAPLRRVLAPLLLQEVAPGDALPVDLDSPADLDAWRRRR
ncbi:MAG: NTP transferase domain-containing protein [Propionibacteriaceae bacterium]|nr:NTP transferase domain-containing protein [Propionibacteriaceae bacterium]